jgi:glycosyltransferase involved in cell wall biosynthesis
MSSGQPTDDAAGPLTLGLPWRFPFYLPLNGPHPLVESYVKDNPSVRTLVLSQDIALRAEHFDQVLPGLCNQVRLISDQQTPDYVKWAAPIEQSMIQAQSDRFSALFHHTTPLHIGSKPWIFHFESFPSLFMPFVFSGATAGVDLKRQGYFERVRQAFSSEACRLIFTHMKSSREVFERMFSGNEITAKLHYIPLGLESRTSDNALRKFERAGPIRILFTNSLHQNPASFFLRGGHHLLRAFSQLREEDVAVELTIISSVPHDLAAYFSNRDLAGVTWITERVDDAVLERLLLDHHVFALPAAGLHSYSLLRALAHGCVPLVSDALGYGEYTDPIQDSVFVVRGVRQMVYRQEREGWISDSYAEFTKPSREFASQIYQIIVSNRDRARLRAMAQVNLDYCASQFDLRQAQREFTRRVAGSL